MNFPIARERGEKRYTSPVGNATRGLSTATRRGRMPREIGRPRKRRFLPSWSDGVRHQGRVPSPERSPGRGKCRDDQKDACREKQCVEDPVIRMPGSRSVPPRQSMASVSSNSHPRPRHTAGAQPMLFGIGASRRESAAYVADLDLLGTRGVRRGRTAAETIQDPETADGDDHVERLGSAAGSSAKAGCIARPAMTGSHRSSKWHYVPEQEGRRIGRMSPRPRPNHRGRTGRLRE